MSVSDRPAATQCPDVMQALDVLAVVEPITGIGACGRFEQIKVVVVMQRSDGHAERSPVRLP